MDNLNTVYFAYAMRRKAIEKALEDRKLLRSFIRDDIDETTTGYYVVEELDEEIASSEASLNELDDPTNPNSPLYPTNPDSPYNPANRNK